MDPLPHLSPAWRVIEASHAAQEARRHLRLFSRTIPEERWVDLPPPIRRRESAQEGPQAA